MRADPRGLIKHIIDGEEVEIYLSGDKGFGDYFIYDVEDFRYDDETDEELSDDAANDWMEEMMDDTAAEYHNKHWHVREIKNTLIVCPMEYKNIIDIIIEASDE